MRHAHALLLPLLLALAPAPARAAESYDNCTGYIDSLPATLTQQGNWCLRADLGTAITAGSAIEIANNNITVDCNHFKLGGLGGGISTGTVGIHAQARFNATIRNCNVRGFLIGVLLADGGGHVIDDNRIESSRYRGIYVVGDGNVIRRNLVIDTGGSPFSSPTAAIYTEGGQALVQDNVVSGVTTGVPASATTGIYIGSGSHSLVQRNFVSGLVGGSVATWAGLVGVGSEGAVFRDNTVGFANPDGSFGYGLVCEAGQCRCRDNVFDGMTTGMSGCTDLGRNDHTP